MLLSEWLDQSGCSQAKLAKQIGVSQQMVCGVLHGQRRFSPEVARKVVELSEGTVTLEELLFPGGFRKASND